MEMTAMESRQGLRVDCPAGLGFSGAFQLAQAAQACPAEISLIHEGHEADAKNLIAVLRLGVCSRAVVTVVASGANAAVALAGLRSLWGLPGSPFVVSGAPSGDAARRSFRE